MSGFAFWCSKCRVDHAGECHDYLRQKSTTGIHHWLPRAAGGGALGGFLDHHWCSRCGAKHPFNRKARFHLPPPETGCPGAPQP